MLSFPTSYVFTSEFPVTNEDYKEILRALRDIKGQDDYEKKKRKERKNTEGVNDRN